VSKTSKARRDAKRKAEKKAKTSGKPAVSTRPIRWMLGTFTRAEMMIPIRDGAGALVIFTDHTLAHTIAKELADAVTPEEKKIVFDAVGAAPSCSVRGISRIKWAALQASQPCRVVSTREEFEEARKSLDKKFREEMLPD
jgi:hypothetical protein